MGSVRLRSISYFYPNDDKPALCEISLNLESHQKLSVVGANLAGKTTLANVIVRSHLGQLAGRLDGKIQIEFKDQETKLVGFLFDDPNWMFCNLRVEDEVGFGLENLLVPPEEIRSRTKAALKAVGLGGFEKRSISTLSGGELQKLAIATAVAIRPGVLVTDDLLANVDVASIPGIVKTVEEFQTSNGTAWINLSREWPEHWNRTEIIGILAAGQMRAIGTADDLWSGMGDALLRKGECHVPEYLEIVHFANNCLTSSGHNPIDIQNGRPHLTREVAARFRVRPKGPLRADQRHYRNSNRQPRLECVDLQFGYDSGKPVLIDCNFEVAAGVVNVLAGRNGSGKSTLAKICSGLIVPREGRLLWDGIEVDGKFLRNRTSLVFQNPEYHFLTDSVLDEFLLTGRVLKFELNWVKERSEEILSKLQLVDRASINPFMLTMGEKRRLAIGVCLLRKPAILFVDEPTLGQDRRQSQLLGKLFRELTQEGVTPVIVSHDPRFIYEFGDVVRLLNGGRIVYAGDIPGLFRERENSDFAGQSAVLDVWETLCPSPGVGGRYPRSAGELFSYLEPRDRRI